jgi:CRISPR-associated protein Cst1
MTEKVYLGDWLYNAGIIGFLRIMEVNDRLEQVAIADNCVSFDRSVLEDFTEYYFNFAHLKANKITERVNRLGTLLNSENTEQEKIKKLKQYIQSITSSKTIKEDILLTQALRTAKETKDWKLIARTLVDHLPAHWDQYKDLYVKYYLLRFYEGKSIFNAAVKSGIKEKFKKDLVEPILDQDQQGRRRYYTCQICNTRKAPKDSFFDEGTFRIVGVSSNEFQNAYWKLEPNTHMCPVCGLMYLCSYAGLSNLTSTGEFHGYIFVNLDTTVDDLYKVNNTLEQFTLSGEGNPYRLTIERMLLDYEQKRSKWTLGNILFIEFNTEGIAHRVRHFHVPKHAAELFTGQHMKFIRGLDKWFYFKQNGPNIEKVDVLSRCLDAIFDGRSLYPLLDSFIRDYINRSHNRANILINIVFIQTLLIQYRERRKEMEDKATGRLWVLYHEGQNLAKILRGRNMENKLDGFVYKFLNALKVEDKKTFYDALTRLYVTLGQDMPSIFLESFSPTGVLEFQAIGYAFLTGLLGKPQQTLTEGGQSNE